MKPRTLSTARLTFPLAAALAALLAAPAAHAALTWDANGITAGQTDGAGVWLTASQWWDGANNVNWTSASDAIFGNGGTGGAVTLASPTTVNSLTLNPYSGTYTLGTAGQTITLSTGIAMNSGAGLATIVSPVTLGAAQSWLNNSSGLLTVGTGAVTNGGYLLTTGGSGNTAVSSVIGGAGGLTKQDAGVLTLSGANTFSGQLTVQNGTLSIASINNVSAAGVLGNSALSVILGNTGAQTGTLEYTGGTTASTKPFTLAAGGTGAFQVDTGAAILTLSGQIDGSGGLTKTGAGTLILTQGNAAGGTATQNNYGVGYVNEFTGTTVVSAGKLQIQAYGTGGAQVTQVGMALQKSVYDTTGSNGSTIGLDLTNSAGGVPTFPWLGGLAGSVTLGSAIIGYSTITQMNLNPQAGVTATYGGVIAQPTSGLAAGFMNKIGPGTQIFTAAETYTGATTIYTGTLGLGGASGSLLNSAVTVKGGTLALDNSAGWTNRLADGTALSLGSLTLNSFNGAGVQAETVGATSFATGGKVTITNGTTGGDQTTLALGTVTRSAGAAIDFVGVNGTLGGVANSPNVTSTGAFPGASNGILPWATVNGTTWATTSSNSIVAYAGSFYDPTTTASDATKNAQLTGSGVMNAVKSFNSLNVITSGASQSFDLSTSGVLTLTSGGILKSGTNAYEIKGSAVSAITSGTELIAQVDGGDLTISAPLNSSIVNLAKGGTGKLILSGTRAATLSGSVSIAGNLEFDGAATTLSGVVSGPGNLTVNLGANQVFTLNNSGNTFSGNVLVKGGVLSGAQAYNASGLSLAPGTNVGSVFTAAGGLNNIELNGGIIYWAYTFARSLGTGPDQFQITGGVSGFTTNNGGSSHDFTIGASSAGNNEVQWGGTYFNPSTLVLQDASGLAGGQLNFRNNLDLNGATRTVAVNATVASGAYSTMSGTIRDSLNSGAGLTKTGVGILQLSGSGTYTGATTINGGVFQLGGGGTTGTLSTSSAISVATNATFAVNRTNTVTQGTDFSGAAIIGGGGFSQVGSGTTVLNATNTYTGPTTISAGTVSVGLSANLGGSASNVVFDGGTLQITGTTINSLSAIGHTITANPGKVVSLDINNAANTFTMDQVLGTTGGLVKAGAGTMVIGMANTYSGPTTISAGTLQYINGFAIPTNPILDNGTLLVTRTDALTQGSTFHSTIGGTGALTLNGAGGSLTLNAANSYSGLTTVTTGTLALTHALALQNSALVTTSGTVTLSGPTTLTLGGLSGATGDLGSGTMLATGYSGVTALTLNPASGVSVSYGGVIADGASGMTLTTTGAGTQTLQGVEIYTGATTLNAGTLNLSGSGSILTTASITLNGGGLTLTNTAAETGSGRINDSTAITANGGTITYTNTSGANVYAETIGSVALTSGQLNLVETNNQASTGSQTLTLSGLTHSGGTNTSAVTFSSASGLNTTKNMIVVTGATATTAGQIIAPWATTGTAANAQTDYAVYNGTAQVVPANLTASAENSGTWISGANVVLSGASTLTATRTVNTLRYTGAAASLVLGTSSYNLETYGLLNGGSGLLTVSATGTGGVLTTPTGGGQLYLTSGNNAITVSAPINDNSGAVTLVKSGSGALTLSGASNFSGGTVINGSGQVTISADNNLGAAGSTLTVNTSVNLQPNTGTYTHPVVINNGAMLSIGGNGSYTFSGNVTGSGGVTASTFNFGSVVILNGTGNTFAGPIIIAPGGSGGNWYNVQVASLADSATANGMIQLANGSTYANAGRTDGFIWTGATNLVLNYRQLVVASTTTQGGSFYNNSTNNSSITINTTVAAAVGSFAAGTRILSLGGTSTGVNTIAGAMIDGPGVTLAPTVTAGTWVFSGANSYTGATTVNGGTLSLSSVDVVANANPLGQSTAAASNLLLGNGTTLKYTGAAASTDRSFTINGTAAGNSATLDASGSGAVNFTSTGSLAYGTTNQTRTLNLTGSNTGANTLAATIANNGTGAVSLTKAGAGTWVLSGANTYTGVTTVSTGTLSLSSIDVVANANPLGKSSAAAANLLLGNGTTLKYTGGAASTDRSFTINGTVAGHQATLDASGSGAVNFTSTSSPAYGTTAQTRTLNLTGSNTGANTLAANIADNGAGAVSLAKSGAGKWVLSGSSTYTGTTTVSAGTLALGKNSALSATTAVSIGSATLDAAAFTNSVGTLNATGSAVINLGGGTLAFADSHLVSWTGTLNLTGTFVSGSSLRFGTSSSGLTSTQLSSITASGYGTFALDTNGYLTATAGSGYGGWATTNAPTGTAANDYDGDGVSNGVEYVLGGSKLTNDLGKLPTLATVGGNLVFSFKRDQASIDGSTIVTIQVGTTLASWPDTYTVGADNGSSSPEVNIVKGVPTGFDTVTLTVPQAPDAKKFARLNVFVP